MSQDVNVFKFYFNCILYFFLVEGIKKLNLRYLNQFYSKTFFGCKDNYEFNCLANDFSQGVALFNYLNQTSELVHMQEFLILLLNHYETFLWLSENRVSAFQLKLNFLSYKNCKFEVKSNQNLSNLLICWMKYILSLKFNNLVLFDEIIKFIGFENTDCDFGIESLIKIHFYYLYIQYKNHSVTLNLIKDIIFELTGASIPFNLYQNIRNIFNMFSS